MCHVLAPLLVFLFFRFHSTSVPSAIVLIPFYICSRVIGVCGNALLYYFSYHFCQAFPVRHYCSNFSNYIIDTHIINRSLLALHTLCNNTCIIMDSNKYCDSSLCQHNRPTEKSPYPTPSLSSLAWFLFIITLLKFSVC